MDELIEEKQDRVREDDAVSALVTTGAGRAFSSGDDASLYVDPERAACGCGIRFADGSACTLL